MERQRYIKLVDRFYSGEFKGDEHDRVRDIVMSNELKINAEQMISVLKQIPSSTNIVSDSGWECDETNCARAFYSEKYNELVLTQYEGNGYQRDSDYIEIYPKGVWK